MVAQLLLEAANLMFIGMVAVFAFLLLLVFVVQLISKIMQRYFPVKIADKAVRIDAGSNGPSPAVIAAISSAIHQYRKQQ
ncbi:OadG family transporter subunit [Rheinheimera baltica]|uniref:Probable oxaloacetate decarboxylase gamma chain n=1 Tax=Rheinheimera baltica TaxID=67576 RepID=A0ABT9I0E2_9GAMM|nr:OadG family transporter subunit [Rheinheimera baltica]MDP5136854.1 OadG family transporter subunit [Rheinheimera baltica]MDP5143916.1 OadG family transporter subunit [Rheinheimera baltica]MDP5151656.1 OadG family transporter subunit [Rheinheimera baltica]